MFIIQHNLMNDDSLNKIKKAVVSNNIPHMFVGVIPFSHEITADVPLNGVDYIPYGSTLMTTLTMDWRGNYFNPQTFIAETWNDMRHDMLNSGDCVMKITSAIKLLRDMPSDKQIFARPSEDLKQFSGMVIRAHECSDWFIDAMKCESSGSYSLIKDTMVVISNVKDIQAEWRWFIVDSKVVSGSMYRRNGVLYKKEELDPNVISEAQRFADVWLPHRNCVMDLALVDDEVKVIEFNTINSSGFYDNDVNEIIKALWVDFNK